MTPALALYAIFITPLAHAILVTMFPRLTETWIEQTDAQKNWQRFQKDDFERLKSIFGVSWVVLEKPGVPGLSCPYENSRLLVCKIE